MQTLGNYCQQFEFCEKYKLSALGKRLVLWPASVQPSYSINADTTIGSWWLNILASVASRKPYQC